MILYIVCIDKCKWIIYRVVVTIIFIITIIILIIFIITIYIVITISPTSISTTLIACMALH